MNIKCPFCKIELAVSDEIEAGRHLQCSDCGGKFMIAQREVKFSKISPPTVYKKMPVAAKVAFSWLYISTALAILDAIAGVMTKPGALVIYLVSLIGGFTTLTLVRLTHQRLAWGRVALTMFQGAYMLYGIVVSTIASKLSVYLVSCAIGIVPYILLWLPPSSRWYGKNR